MPTLDQNISVAAGCLLCFGFVFDAAAHQKSLWTYSDSVMYLVVNGQEREFRYQDPRPALIPFGVTPGTLAFRGFSRDGEYVGTAFTFTRECGALSFQARGPILDNGERVLLAGRLPQVDARCQRIGSTDHELEFRLVKGVFDKVPPNGASGTQNSSAQTGVQLKKVGGTFVVPVEINGAITLDFTIDSGAADVSVPADVFSTLMRTGTIRDTDIIGEQTYVLADGSEAKSITFTTRSLKVGNTIVENVRGSIVPAKGSLLLGQSFVERFRSWSMDNTKHVLLLDSR
jgi:predicted aspartyl protease